MRSSFLFTVLMLAATPALACATLEHAVPKVGATVGHAPATVTLDFSMGVDPAHSTLTVADIQGHVVSSGAAYRPGADRDVLATRLGPLPPGKYKVTWSILADCGEQEPGDYKFTVAPLP